MNIIGSLDLQNDLLLSHMNSGSLLLTTSQAAELLQVHESSVKRWANEGKLKPAKTEGGHRRISLPELLDFARVERADSDLIYVAPFTEELAVAALACRERNYFQPLAKLIVDICDTHPSSFLVATLNYLESAFEISKVRAFDLGIAEALRIVGNQWASGERSIAQERRFTQKIIDAIHQLRRPLVNPPDKLAPLAIVGCSESCYHEVGSLYIRSVLEEAGWNVCYLGVNVPFSEYGTLQSELNAKLVAISFVSPSVNSDARRCLTILSGLYRDENPYYLAFGGGGLNKESIDSKGWPFLALRLEKDSELFQIWARQKAILNKNLKAKKG